MMKKITALTLAFSLLFSASPSSSNDSNEVLGVVLEPFIEESEDNIEIYDSEFDIDTDNDTVYSDEDNFETDITLEGFQWSDDVSAEDITLSEGFEGMTVVDVIIKSPEEVSIITEGNPVEGDTIGTIEIDEDVLIPIDEDIDDKTFDEIEDEFEELETEYYVDIEIIEPDVIFDVKNTDNNSAALELELIDTKFSSDVKASDFVISGIDNPPEITSFEKTSDTKGTIVIGNEKASDIFSKLESAIITISENATEYSGEISVPTSIYNADIFASVTEVIDAENGYEAVIELSVSNGTLFDISKENLSFDGDISEILEFTKQDDTTGIIKAIISSESELSALEFYGNIFISGNWGKNSWGEEKSDAQLSVYYLTPSFSESSDDYSPVQNYDNEWLFDLLKSGFNTLSNNILKSAVTTIWGNILSDVTVQEDKATLKSIDEYLKSSNLKLTSELSDLKFHVEMLSTELSKRDTARTLKDFNSISNELKATLFHLDSYKYAVENATEGTAEYDAAVSAYISEVKAQSKPIYTQSYVYGEELLGDSSGINAGISSIYDELLSYIYNFDSQTYDKRIAFRNATLLLYLKAYDHTALYYNLTDPENRQFDVLTTQLATIGDYIEKDIPTKSAEGTVYCYPAGKTLSLKTMSLVGRHLLPIYSMTQYVKFNVVTAEHAEAMVHRAKLRNTTLSEDISSSGFLTYDGKPLPTDEILYLDMRGDSKKQTKVIEFWETMSKVNTVTGKIEKDVRVFYERQEFKWVIFLLHGKFEKVSGYGSYVHLGFTFVRP